MYCSYCSGEGTVKRHARIYTEDIPCPLCGGSGLSRPVAPPKKTFAENMHIITPDQIRVVKYSDRGFDLENEYVALKHLGKVIEACLEVGKWYGRAGDEKSYGSEGQYGEWRAKMRELLDKPCHHVFTDQAEPECIYCGECKTK